MFTTLAAAAGVKDVAEKVKQRRSSTSTGRQPGVLKGELASPPQPHFHYNESKLAALRMGPWKWHFATSEDYYGTIHRAQ